MDTQDTTATAGPTRYINIGNSATGVTPITYVSDGTGSGIEIYEWTDQTIPVGLTFSATNVPTPYINTPSDGTYTARLRVKDCADNWSANCDVTIKRDTVAPVVTFNVDQSEYAYWWDLREHPTVKLRLTWKWIPSETGTFDIVLTDYKGNIIF